MHVHGQGSGNHGAAASACAAASRLRLISSDLRLIAFAQSFLWDLAFELLTGRVRLAEAVAPERRTAETP